MLVGALLATNAVIAPSASYAAVMTPTVEFPYGPLDGQRFNAGTTTVMPQGLSGGRVGFEFEILGPFEELTISVSPGLGISGWSNQQGDPVTCFITGPMQGDPNSVPPNRSSYLGGSANAWTNPVITPPQSTCTTVRTTIATEAANDVTPVYIETVMAFPVSAGTHAMSVAVKRTGATTPETVGTWTVETQAGGGGGGPGVQICNAMPPPSASTAGVVEIYRAGCNSWPLIDTSVGIQLPSPPPQFVNPSFTVALRYTATQSETVTRITVATTGTLKLDDPFTGKCMNGNLTNISPGDTNLCEGDATTGDISADVRVFVPPVGTDTITVTLFDGQTQLTSISFPVAIVVGGQQQQQQQTPAAPQLPVVLSPQGVGRAIGAPSSVWGMIGGRPAVTVVNTPSVGQLTAQIGTVQLALVAPETNGSPLSGGGFVSKGGELDITASGFFPFSAVRVWSVSEQRLLATSIVSADGTVELDVTLPNRPNACRETVQISGSDASAEQIAASLTLRYALDNPFAKENGAAQVHAGALACLANRGVMSGVTEDRAAAGRIITRAQVAALITRALGLNGQSTAVTDVNQNVHQDAIRAAIAAGLITPFDDGTFRPDMPVTRAELVRIVATAANIQPADTTGFTDVNGETARLAEALRQAGIVRGTTDTRFNPDTFATRAQTASIIDNLLALIETSR